MELREGLRTTGAVRAFTDEPVDEATIAELLDDARFAPSGGNRQAWRVAVVVDPDLRARLGALMRPVFDEYVAHGGSGAAPFTVAPPPDGPLPSRPTPLCRTRCST